VRVEVERLTGVYKNMVRGVVALVFRCSPAAGHPRRTTESADVRWVERSEIGSMMREAFAVRVADAFTEGCQVRSHDGHALS
jgi:8-oxo-dGTP diphosphatase